MFLETLLPTLDKPFGMMQGRQQFMKAPAFERVLNFNKITETGIKVAV